MNVGEICSRDPVTVHSSATLGEVAQLMCERRIGTVLVTRTYTDAPNVVGLITDRDIVRTQLERKSDLWCLGAEAAMTRDVLMLAENVSVSDAIERLAARRVRRAPVVTTHGILMGIVSTDDLLGVVAREVAGLARLFELQTRGTGNV
jgi:CBS domain-containing protein